MESEWSFWGSGCGKYAIVVVVGLAVVYILFQRHLLPPCLARPVARIFLYPTLPLTVISRGTNYWTMVDSTLIFGAVPIASLGHVKRLHAFGVRTVINMCDEYEGPVEAYAATNIKQVRLMTVDHSEPTLENMIAAVNILKNAKKSGEMVYVHCKSGNGRSAAIAFCWLLADKNLSPREAQLNLLSRRRVRKRLYKQPNVLAFHRTLSLKDNSKGVTEL